MTGDAEYCQRALSEQVVAGGGAYLWAVKANQPTLLEELVVLFADPPPGEPVGVDLRFGRRGDREELRLLRCSAALMGYTDWPQLGTVAVVQRVVTRKGETTYEEA